MLVILVAWALVLHAQTSGIPPADQDPFVGHWEANANESRPNLNDESASYERIVARNGDALVFSSQYSKTKVQHYEIRCDGRFYTLPTGPKVSCLYIATNRVEGETNSPDMTHYYWVREVSSDRMRMTITTYKDKARTIIHDVMVLDRIP
jgi:hypothetical protein